MSELHYEVLVHAGVPRNRPQRLPDGGPIVSSPLSSTLIHGDHEALLVDPPFTYDQTRDTVDWIRRSGKRLAYIYATHGHGDHWFGTAELRKEFPDAVPYATSGTIEVMNLNNQLRDFLWDKDFPEQIPPSPIVYEVIPADGLDLEGHRVLPIDVGHTDTDNTTVLHVPSVGLVVAGDVVYNGVHQMLLETGETGFQSWLAALDTVEALHPRAVITRHEKTRICPTIPRPSTRPANTCAMPSNFSPNRRRRKSFSTRSSPAIQIG